MCFLKNIITLQALVYWACADEIVLTELVEPTAVLINEINAIDPLKPETFEFIELRSTSPGRRQSLRGMRHDS